MTFVDIKDLVQIVFWIFASSITFLTYRNINKSLLSPVNTEYQKRVLENLSVLSNKLFSELKSGTQDYRGHSLQMQPIWKQMQSLYIEDKDSTRENGIDILDINITSEFLFSQNLADEVRYDPFIPNEIREAVTTYLDCRTKVSFDSTVSSLHDTLINIDKIIEANGEVPSSYFEEDINIFLENTYLDYMDNNGFSDEIIEEMNKNIMTQILEYIDSFNPRFNKN
ncbi:hypothetical protein [Moritella sp. Urea-trap-13]|uniref:hypothetical protein n=1 Tax=Moritella sp. Urea-trap-13 TaxID=2058327 RepID=UPI000C332A40|nr:hypothetical protein [Moritella sp. Urea-trap-13]PKH08179.1 hypothetical protein CXF93_05750 [Moritella sp. Urea-trap-13]